MRLAECRGISGPGGKKRRGCRDPHTIGNSLTDPRPDGGSKLFRCRHPAPQTIRSPGTVFGPRELRGARAVFAPGPRGRFAVCPEMRTCNVITSLFPRRGINDAAHRSRSRRGRVSLETLEGRQLLSTLYVTTDDDSGDNNNPTPGSLRAAIVASNNAPVGTVTTIDFNIAPGGAQTIPLIAPLPTLANPTIIDGTTQPGYSRPAPHPGRRHPGGRRSDRLLARRRFAQQHDPGPGDHRLQRRRHPRRQRQQQHLQQRRGRAPRGQRPGPRRRQRHLRHRDQGPGEQQHPLEPRRRRQHV